MNKDEYRKVLIERNTKHGEYYTRLYRIWHGLSLDKAMKMALSKSNKYANTL